MPKGVPWHISCPTLKSQPLLALKPARTLYHFIGQPSPATVTLSACPLDWLRTANVACATLLNNAEFRHFTEDGQPAGHDNFNYPVVTWQHRFNQQIHTKQEAYFMWQLNA